jgi:hypothetical protein
VTKSASDALRATAHALKAQADALLALADATDSGSSGDPFLDVDQALERYGTGREALKAAAERGEIELHRGARGKLLVRESAVQRWIESRPHKPRPRRAASVETLATWEAETEADLRRMGGAR